MAQDPLRTAWFRFEQISPLLDTGLAAAERRRLMENMATIPVFWPTGRIANNKPLQLTRCHIRERIV